MEWDIRPMDGIGPLKLGMTQSEVGTLLNAAAPITGRFDEEGGFLREVRGISTPICHYLNGNLCLVDTHVRVPNVSIFDIDVYSADPLELLKRLELKNGGAKINLGWVIFERLGINTENFYIVKERRFFEKNPIEQDDRGIAIYQPYADTEPAEVTPITFF